MSSFSDLQFTQIILAILGSAAVVGGAIYAVFRKTWCSGKDKGVESANVENRIKFLEEAHSKVDSELELLKQDIQNYRSKTEEKLDEIKDNQSELKSDVSYIKGIIKAKLDPDS